MLKRSTQIAMLYCIAGSLCECQPTSLTTLKDNGSFLEWTFSNGEFAGSSGSLQSCHGRVGVGGCLEYNFSCDEAGECGHYVAALWRPKQPVAVPPNSALEISIKAPSEVKVAVRIVDSSGQTLQYYPEIERLENQRGDDWRSLTIPLDSRPVGHWGGKDNGSLNGGITLVGLCADNRMKLPVKGVLNFDEMRLVPFSRTHIRVAPTSKEYINIAPGALGPRLGVSIHSLSDTTGLDIAKSAGFTFVRADLSWNRLEANGSYDFGPFDRLRDDAKQRQMSILWVLGYGHPDHGGNSPNAAEDVAAFSRYCKASAEHYYGQNFSWEIWNEPNINFPSKAIYKSLLDLCSQQMRLAERQANISNGGMSSIDIKYLQFLMGRKPSLELSAIAIHPYRPFPETIVQDTNVIRNDLFPDDSSSKQPGRPTLPIWASEWGYTSYDDAYGPTNSGHSESSRNRQAIMAVREILVCWLLDFKKIVWYDLRDDNDNAVDKESNFGLVTKQNQAKPVLDAVRVLTQTVQNLKIEGLLKNLPPRLHAIKMIGNRELLLIVWTDEMGGKYSLDLPAKDIISITDAFGNHLKQSNSINGEAVIELAESQGPIYIRSAM